MRFVDRQIGFTRCSWSQVSARSNKERQDRIGYDRTRSCWSQFSACSDYLRPPFEIKLMSEAPLPTSALMQAASTLLLSALILTHPTTFHITSCWGALFCPDSVRLSMWCVVVSSWSYSSQLSEIAWVKKSRFTPLCFISLQSIYEDLF